MKDDRDHRAIAHERLKFADSRIERMDGTSMNAQVAMVQLLEVQTSLLQAVAHLLIAQDEERVEGDTWPETARTIRSMPKEHEPDCLHDEPGVTICTCPNRSTRVGNDPL